MSSELKSMHMGQVTSFFIPNVTLVGQHCSKEIPNRLKALGGKHPLVVTDKGIVACGILKQITDILDAAKVAYTVFDGAVPNPTDKNVEDATKVYLDNKCDSLISIGGGSSHDCAKGVGFVAGNGGRIQDYEGVDKSNKPFPPYVAVNTTAGTGSEMTRFCIITDTARKVKMAIIDWRCTPSVAIDDPVLMMGMPPSLTAATGMDALTHAVEAYTNLFASKYVQNTAREAVYTIFQTLPRAVENGEDLEARGKMLHASMQAGIAFTNNFVGYVHALAHAIGGLYGVPHGKANAVLLPAVFDGFGKSAYKKLSQLAAVIGVEKATEQESAAAFLAAVRELRETVKMPENFPELRPADYDQLINHAMKEANPMYPVPEIWGRESFLRVLRAVTPKN